MGEGLLCWYRDSVKKEYKIAFSATFVIALMIHLYKFTNTLLNHDSVYNYYSDQNVLGSGRWALSLACGISSYYDLPWVIGLFSCVLIGLTVVVVTALFQLKNPVLIGLVGALLAASPATTETFFFLFTADGYMLAMLLAALAVWFSRIEEKRVSRLVLSAVCVCVSCGIYQAYVSFALLLAVCWFIDVLLQDRYDAKACFRWVVRQAVIYITALASYYIIWKVCLRVTGTAVNDYQGISEVGKISIGLLINGAVSAVKTFILYFLQWNVLEHGFTLYSVLSILFILVMAIGLLLAFVKSGIFRRKWAVVLVGLCLLAIVPFACIWHFTSDSVGYRALMLQSLTLLFVLTAVLFERWAKPGIKDAVCLFLMVIVLNNALMANISYFYLHMCYERTYAEAAEMMAEIHDLQDEYEFDKIAVLGTRLLEVSLAAEDPETGKMHVSGKIHILSGLLEKTLLFDSDHTTNYLKAVFGLDLDVLEYAQRNELLNTNEVRAMGCWPAGDSITVMGDTLVIKLSDRKEGE